MESIKHHILKQSSKHLIFGLTSVDFHQLYTRLGNNKYLKKYALRAEISRLIADNFLYNINTSLLNINIEP